MARSVNMQRGHFEIIADVLAKLSTYEDMEGLTPVVARAFADALELTNSNFDRARFLEASGVPEEKADA